MAWQPIMDSRSPLWTRTMTGGVDHAHSKWEEVEAGGTALVGWQTSMGGSMDKRQLERQYIGFTGSVFMMPSKGVV